ncbi:MAG: vWA domain-containing protein [Acidimicrobiales bacterium]
MRSRGIGPSISILALVVASCGGAAGVDLSTGPTTPAPGPSTTTTPTAILARGWLEGDDLDWFGGGGVVAAEAAPEADAASGIASDGAATDEAATVAPEPLPPVADGPLRAGSIDDGADVAAYLEYRAAITDAGVEVRSLDVSDPTTVTVIGNNGMPILGAELAFWNPVADESQPRVILHTSADGSARFLPGAMSGVGLDTFEVVVQKGEASAIARFERGQREVEVRLATPGGVVGAVAVDVHFVLDATGSMGDEIARLRDNMAAIATEIDALPSDPDVRFGMTVYRDEGDLFVTRTFDLTDDLDAFLAALGDVVADGGGDYPEALDEALADALDKPSWRRDDAVELMILIADAPPQIARDLQVPYTRTALDAAALGVKILPVAASGTDDQAEYVMRELAFVTGGRFVFLSYGEEGSATGTGSDITPADYDELPLDRLVVRLVEDEVLALTGAEPSVATTTTLPATTTTYRQ